MNETTKTVVNAVRYAVKTRAAWETYVAENNVTRETIAEHARTLAGLAYPSDEPVQSVRDENGRKVRTRYGNAVQAAGYMMRSVLATDDDSTAPTVALLTKAGLKATREEVMAAWEAGQTAHK